MKKRAVLLLIVGLFLSCMAIMTACDSRKPLPTPINLRKIVFEGELILTWDQVDYSTGGYLLDINGDLINVGENKYGIKHLNTAEYKVRVKALTIDANYFFNSEWSEYIEFFIEKESGVQYRLINDGSEYEISGIGTASGDILIFNNHPDGRPITRVGDSAFYNATALTGITLSKNITSIGKYAFASCSSLVRITIPESVTIIEQNAFANCRIIKNIELPAGLKSLGINAFMGCRALQEMVIPEAIKTVPESLFMECFNLISVTFAKETRVIEYAAFAICIGLKSITIPSTVDLIGDYAFYSTGLESVIIEEGVDVIGYAAFKSASKLANVSLPTSLSRISFDAFSETLIWNQSNGLVYVDNWLVGCNDGGVKFANVRPGTEGIADQAFYDFKEITSAEIPDSVKHIGRFAFTNTALWNNSEEIVYIDNWAVGFRDEVEIADRIIDFTFPNGIIGISDYSFAGSYFKQITLPLSVKSIGNYAFSNSSKLEKISMTDNVEFIGQYAFRACEALVSITLPSGLTRISNGMFYACISIELVNIPKNVTYIGEDAFLRNDLLAKITIPDGVTYIGRRAFYSCSSLTSLELPDSVTYIGEEFVSRSSNLTTVVLSNNITVIPYAAFFGCMGLSSINIPENLVSIKENGFAYTSLIDVVLPDTVTELDKEAFNACSSLLSVVLSKNLKKIGDYAFAECSKLQNIMIPEGTTRIGEFAFLKCHELKRIYIPKSVTSIGRFAFLKCETLVTIGIGSNVIGMGENAFFGCSLLTIYSEHPFHTIDWAEHWNSGKRPVVWGSVLSEDKTYVVSVFIAKDSINNLEELEIQNPVREDYVFSGWTTKNGGTQAEYENLSEVPENTRVYAIWIKV